MASGYSGGQSYIEFLTCLEMARDASKLPKDITDPKKKKEYMDRFSDQTIQNKTQSYFASLRMQAKIEPIDPYLQRG